MAEGVYLEAEALLQFALDGRMGRAGLRVGAEVVAEGAFVVPLAFTGRVDVDVNIRAMDVVPG